MVIFVHMASVWVPFTSESKEAIAEYDEIHKEITLALRECGRRLGAFLRRRERAHSEFRRRNIFELYIEEIVESCNRLKGGRLPTAKLKEQLQKMANVEERKKQLEEQLKKAGMPQEQIKQELAKLDAQAQDMQKMQQLAEKIGQMQEALAKQDTEKMLESLEMTKADLQQMMQQLQELDMLEQAMNELQDMKNAMVCVRTAAAEADRPVARTAVAVKDSSVVLWALATKKKTSTSRLTPRSTRRSRRVARWR